MKQFIFIILVLWLVIPVGCKKKVLPAPEIKFGTISDLTVNGFSLPRTDMKLRIWGGYFRSCNTTTYGISIYHETSKNIRFQEYFSFYFLPIDKLGKIKLSPLPVKDTCDFTPSGDFFMTKGNDQLIANYNLLRMADNYLFIESFDKIKNEVTGTIDVTFIGYETSAASKAIYPDTIRFANAKFTVPLNK
jgi:hypothetical protein